MMVLWILATPDTFRSVGVKFEVSKSTVHFHYKYIIEALREMAPLYMAWPNAYERELISNEFEALYGYPSVCGWIDGCLIHITAPLEQPQEYVDRHHQYSILLQGVCDYNLLFRDVYIGEPGSVGDKRTFRRSPLGRNILRDPLVVGDKHLLGDGGYTLTSKVNYLSEMSKVCDCIVLTDLVETFCFGSSFWFLTETLAIWHDVRKPTTLFCQGVGHQLRGPLHS